MKHMTAVVLAVIATGCGAEADTLPEDSAAPAYEAEVEAVRVATEKYRDVDVALAEGFIQDPSGACEVAEMMGMDSAMGAMGVHFFRPDLLQITATEPRVAGMGTHSDFLQPAVLLYEPQVDGSWELVAVENVVFKAGWDAAGHSGRPEFAGVEYDFMEDDPTTDLDEGHLFEPHYDRHIWLFRDNPNGIFAQFNPDVTCEHHDGGDHGH